MSEHNLLPCPFCGCAATILYDPGNEVWGQSWKAGCASCRVGFGASGSSTWAVNKSEDRAAQEKVIEAWNRRVQGTKKPHGYISHRAAGELLNRAFNESGYKNVTVVYNGPYHSYQVPIYLEGVEK